MPDNIPHHQQIATAANMIRYAVDGLGFVAVIQLLRSEAHERCIATQIPRDCLAYAAIRDTLEKGLVEICGEK